VTDYKRSGELQQPLTMTASWPRPICVVELAGELDVATAAPPRSWRPTVAARSGFSERAEP
jgi:hypothetical protein